MWDGNYSECDKFAHEVQPFGSGSTLYLFCEKKAKKDAALILNARPTQDCTARKCQVPSTLNSYVGCI